MAESCCDCEELEDNDLLSNVVMSCNENKQNKRRRMSVCQLKQKKSQMKGDVTDYSRHENISIPRLWQSIAKRTLMLKDPFCKFKLTELPTSKVIRYQYDSINRRWTTDEVYIKMEKKPFNCGAMRECFRVKKIPTYQKFTKTENDWKYASNYVGKRYMEDVARDVYFEDVRLQMDAKLWAEEFNLQTGVKKKVDIVKMCVVEFVDLPDKPLYHLEHFIEGNYIKYNSNSGFVDERTRNTPQAFSHFTFEKSGHELIVVDVQGVGDLYTDPQIHTACQTGYGDGNLGCRGMALFFHSHTCNMVCNALGLDTFDLAESEKSTDSVFQSKKIGAATVGRTRDSAPMKSLRTSRPSNSIENALVNILDIGCHGSQDSEMIIDGNNNINNNNNNVSVESISELESVGEKEGMIVHDSGNGDQMIPKSLKRQLAGQLSSPDSGFGADSYDIMATSPIVTNQCLPPSSRTKQQESFNGRPRFHFDSAVSEDWKRDGESLQSFSTNRHTHRPSCAAFLMLQGAAKGESILGKIHHEIANMHQSGRFVNKERPNEEVDWSAILFHEQMAADLNYKDSIIMMCHYYLDWPNTDILSSCPVKADIKEQFRGWMYLTKAAENNHLPSILALADSSDVAGCKEADSVDWCTVAHWLEKAIDCLALETECQDFDITNQSYQVKARLGSMYRRGGYGLEKKLERSMDLYSEAADEATAAMKGRLASQYYEIVEEISGEME